MKFFLTIAILAIATTAFAQSCPMCKESMTQAGAKLSEGFYLSIMSMFFLTITLMGTGTAFIAKTSWMKRHPEAENLSVWQVLKKMIAERKKN